MSLTNPHALLIWNPIAGRRPERRRTAVEAAAGLLRAAGWRVDLAETEAAGGAEPAARRGVAAGYDVLIACGGDGTLAQVGGVIMDAAATALPKPHLALLPAGTANVFAREIGAPRNLLAAARALPHTQPRRIPIGRATYEDGRVVYFLALASAGFDAHVVAAVGAGEKRRWGKLAFVRTALRELFRFHAKPMQVRYGDESAEATLVIFGLAQYYAGGFRLGRRRALLTPTLVGLRPGGSVLLAAAHLIAGRLHLAPGVFHGEPHAATLSGHAVALELDGEAAGSTPVRLDVVPDALDLLCAVP